MAMSNGAYGWDDTNCASTLSIYICRRQSVCLAA